VGFFFGQTRGRSFSGTAATIQAEAGIP